ncbi:hypothetical protein J2W40_000916 [Sphingobium xenophagum]|uniref:Uncharacterized protein n=1 Tax=Sphingobium xenophagum TaxID=121428 RepID=A0ABU1WXS0_SPHXE|nr:hypothetical protein [Sphingobium xenophagum]MDR7154113.1 hypothetical protein [Sphingobium xenophagum]
MRSLFSIPSPGPASAITSRVQSNPLEQRTHADVLAIPDQLAGAVVHPVVDGQGAADVDVSVARMIARSCGKVVIIARA